MTHCHIGSQVLDQSFRHLQIIDAPADKSVREDDILITNLECHLFCSIQCCCCCCCYWFTNTLVLCCILCAEILLPGATSARIDSSLHIWGAENDGCYFTAQEEKVCLYRLWRRLWWQFNDLLKRMGTSVLWVAAEKSITVFRFHRSSYGFYLQCTANLEWKKIT